MLKTGRLVKKEDAKILKLLDVREYPWLHFNEQSIVSPDNPMRSVILNRLHDPEEIKQKVSKANILKQAFGERTKTLEPVDLTKDFEEAQRELLLRRKRSLMDEEEVMALELAELDAQDSKRDSFYSTIQRKPTKNEENEDKKENNNEPNENISEPDASIENKVSHTEQQNHDIESQFIKKEAETRDNNFDLEKMKKEAFEVGKKEGFSVGESEGIEEGLKKGHNEGYELGYRDGEEKAIIAIESKYDTAFSAISDAVLRIDSLKKELLIKGKDIFIELVKICSEKVLREQLKINNNSLSHLIDEVLKVYDSKSSLHIEMNSTDISRVKTHIKNLDRTTKIDLKENNALKEGDFNIESDTGISIINLRKSVELVIDSLKEELFSKTEEELDIDNN